MISQPRRMLPGLVVGLLAIASCASNLRPGQIGTLRYAGNVFGMTPLEIIPPVADPTGNVYVLYGGLNLPMVQAFVGHVAGGWSSSCTLTKGDSFGAHGWAGFAAASATSPPRQWYWSGDALVSVSGADGSCHKVLDQDPSTSVDLLFQAVIPWVRDLSEKRTLVALVKGATDPLPYSALVDLDAEILTNIQSFAPSDAANLKVIGVGGNRDQELGVVLVQYDENGSTALEARYFDADGNISAKASINGGPFPVYGAQGYIQLASNGTGAALIASDSSGAPPMTLIVFNRNGGNVISIPSGINPVGVHSWKNSLWLVGTDDTGPIVAHIDNQGNIAVPQRWTSSQALATATVPAMSVIDDRSLPSTYATWTGVRTATGQYPLLGPFGLTPQADGTSLWAFAGPTYGGSSGTTLTAFAMAPVGVSYP